jgi:predicted TIM-barrel fold metal-dependent hydrolase
MDYFDCNAMIGALGSGPEEVSLSVAGLLEEMERYGIKQALVTSTAALEYNARAGNQVLAREIEAHANLFPLYALTPDPGALEEAAALLPSRPFAALLAADREHHNFSLREWCSGPLLAALEQRNIPVFLRPGLVGWEEMAAVLEAHSNLPVVVTHTGYRADRYIYPLARRYPRLMVETSMYVGHRQLEEFAQTFGAERLLFGTNLPYYTPGAALAVLAYARLSEAERARVAGGNLTLLLERQA